MATKKKMLQAAAGNATGGAGLDITDVFSTYLYEGNNNGSGAGPNPTRKITNGINLLDEGGLVWLKDRDTNPYSGAHRLMDSERSTFQSSLSSDNTDAQSNQGTAIINSVQDDGFTLGYSGYTNYTGDNHASWTFRKTPKFFDVVTYTGDGTSSRSIPHNLGCEVGSILVKRTDSAANWMVFHRSLATSQFLNLNTTSAVSTSSVGFGTNGNTTTTFSVGAFLNGSGRTFVAYVFAHNDGDGEFGPDGDQDIIKCGSYTGNGSYLGGPEIDLGFEPQWVMLKNAESTGDWLMFDNMRGIDDSTSTKFLEANTSSAENTTQGIKLTSTGFQVTGNNIDENSSGVAYIYIAIRRGPLAPPESATEVFDVEFGSASPKPWFKSGFPVDFGFFKNKDATGNWQSGSRLTQGTSLNPNKSQAEEISSSTIFDYQNGWYNNFGASTSWLSWMWKRAPNFFDVVAYTGNGTSGNSIRTAAIPHNLGVQPEMIWVKRRDSTSEWVVAHKDYGAGYLNLNISFAAYPVGGINHNDAFTATTFKINGWQQEANFNVSGATYIAYLFASLPGISKVGSYTGNGSSQTIDCGFTSGARFVLIKRTDSSGDWNLYDTERGMVAGNDSRLSLNTTDAEDTSNDRVDPSSSGFAVNYIATGTSDSNISGASYIFYAIA